DRSAQSRIGTRPAGALVKNDTIGGRPQANLMIDTRGMEQSVNIHTEDKADIYATGDNQVRDRRLVIDNFEDDLSRKPLRPTRGEAVRPPSVVLTRGQDVLHSALVLGQSERSATEAFVHQKFRILQASPTNYRAIRRRQTGEHIIEWMRQRDRQGT